VSRIIKTFFTQNACTEWYINQIFERVSKNNNFLSISSQTSLHSSKHFQNHNLYFSENVLKEYEIGCGITSVSYCQQNKIPIQHSSCHEKKKSNQNSKTDLSFAFFVARKQLEEE